MTDIERLTNSLDLAAKAKDALNNKFHVRDVERRAEVAYVKLDGVLKELKAAIEVAKAVQP